MEMIILEIYVVNKCKAARDVIKTESNLNNQILNSLTDSSTFNDYFDNLDSSSHKYMSGIIAMELVYRYVRHK